MKFRQRLHRLRDDATHIARESRALLWQPATRAQWLATVAAPVGLYLLGGLLLGIFPMPAVIDAVAGWITPDLHRTHIFGIITRHANPLRPWAQGLLWLAYGGGVLFLAARAAWHGRPADDAERTQIAAGAADTQVNPQAQAPRYRLENELGRGAMGVVYRAEDTRLRRPVALKVLLPHIAHDPELRARFLREAQAVARLNHRNIVQVYDLTEDAAGCSIAMEFVRGPSLAELAGRQPQAIADVLRWSRAIADALACAHEQNVIHRDLKPANVLMAELTQPKITDFGLARLTDSESHATQVGTVMGSPAYMSPEQAAGLVADHRSDIYAFGILLYELLAGRPPFTGDSTQVMAAQVTRVPDDIRDKRDDMPQALATLVMELLAKAPDDRPASMRIVAARLAAL